MRLYLDASAIIYAIEGGPGLKQAVIRWIERAESDAAGVLITSHLSRLECRIKPLRQNNGVLLAAFDGFFARKRVLLVDVSPAILDRATDFRVRYNLQTPDAIHAATAFVQQADALLTGDPGFNRVTECHVVQIDPADPA